MQVIQFTDVWEMYRLKLVIGAKVSWENFWALREISFCVDKGECLGLVGPNGAGKSTILKLIMGILEPDRGSVKVLGRVSGLLELGAGFQQELTGLENLNLIASLFGLDNDKIAEISDDVIGFADIGKFINAPVKYYSQGMFVRLAFAVAAHVDPDILLIDDALAVGDEYFQKKCLKKIIELKDRGKNIILVTHDLNILPRFCERALFIQEGRVTRDSGVEKIIILFRQMIGVKKGICVLENKSTTLIFNNGSLLCNKSERALTSGPGIHFIFSIAGNSYSSLQADWRIERHDENKLAAVGNFCELDVVLKWRIEISGERKVSIAIECSSPSPLEIDDAYVNIFLDNHYSKWRVPFEAAEFPGIDTKNFQSIAEFRDIQYIGLEAYEGASSQLPNVIFEQLDKKPFTETRILNGDFSSNCRMIQYKSIGSYGRDRAGAENRSQLNVFTANIWLDDPDFEARFKSIENMRSIESGKLKITSLNGKAMLFYDGKSVTKANHLSSFIRVNRKWYHSALADWKLEKAGDNRFIAKLTWHDVPIEQIWHIAINPDNSFDLNVGLSVNAAANVEEQFVQFDCVSDYDIWVVDSEKGEFPAEYSDVESDMVQKCICGSLIGLESQAEAVPGIYMTYSKEKGTFAKILNSDFYSNARVLRIKKVEPEIRSIFNPGKHAIFEIHGRIDERERTGQRSRINTLGDNKLKFIFNKGNGALYWGADELTKKYGLYTSMRLAGRWYSSSCATWAALEHDDNLLSLVGKWHGLGLSQRWEMRLREGRILDFMISMKVERAISVDRLQANIMLSEKYNEWFSSAGKGFFPEFRPDLSDDWDICWAASTDGSDKYYAGVLKQETDGFSLPQLTLSAIEVTPGWSLNILNSDLEHRGRVLQWLKKENETILPGEYRYCNASIKIEEF